MSANIDSNVFKQNKHRIKGVEEIKRDLHKGKAKKIKKKSSSFVSNFIKDIFNNFHIRKTISVNGFVEGDDHAIRINNPLKSQGIYGLELKNASSTMDFLNKDDINAIVNDYKYVADGYIIRALVKNASVQKNYIFSYNKKLAQFIATRFGTELIEADEMLNVLKDLTLDNEHKHNINDNTFDRVLKMNENFDYCYLHQNYNKTIGNAILKNFENLNVYQGIGFKDLKNDGEKQRDGSIKSKTANLSKLFASNFKGVLYEYISFNQNSSRARIDSKMLDVKQVDKKTFHDLEIVKDSILDNRLETVSINSTLFIDKSTDIEGMSSHIGECLGITFQSYAKSFEKKRRLIKYTPLIERNEEFTEVVKKEHIYDYIGSVHKELSPKAQMFGTDHHGAFTNYNLKNFTPKAVGQKEHFGVFGETGSSKTTFINALKSQMIHFDWENYQIGDMNGYKFREFDIKKSLRPFAQFVKTHNENSVSIMETKLNEFSYNLLNCGYNDKGELLQEDISFTVETTSFILESMDKELRKAGGLSFDEKGLYKEIITDIYSNKRYQTLTIDSLGEYQPHLAQELKDLGYSGIDNVNKITHKQYAYLNKPTLRHILAILDKQYSNNNIKNDGEQFKTVISLRKKIKTVVGLGAYKTEKGTSIDGYYARYEAFDLNSDKRWLLFDFDSIKDNKSDYPPVMWILINKLINQDKADQIKLREAGLPEPKIYYFLEEAHNIFTSSMFNEDDKNKDSEKEGGYFSKAAREWRSYGIFIVPISQQAWHIPKEVFDALETKFFLFPSDEQTESSNGVSKDVQIYGNSQTTGLKELMGLNEKSTKLMQACPQFVSCAINSVGTFTIKLHTNEKMRKIFDNKLRLSE